MDINVVEVKYNDNPSKDRYIEKLKNSLNTDNDIDKDTEVIDERYFEWNIYNWSKIDITQSSHEFKVGGFKWKILLFPHGYGNNKEYVSIFIINTDLKKENSNNSRVLVKFFISIGKKDDYDSFYSKKTNFYFDTKNCIGGFKQYIKNSDLILKMDNLLFENRKIVISTYIRIYKDDTSLDNFNEWDSKTNTGYIGFKKKLNYDGLYSLLQILYFNKPFRKAIYQIGVNKEKPNGILLALQNIFFDLQYSELHSNVEDLVKSLQLEDINYNNNDSVFFSKLQNYLIHEMKNTMVDKTLSRLFKFKIRFSTKCVNINHTVDTTDEFEDISLSIRGCKNLVESFDNFIKTKYCNIITSRHGVQLARKDVIIESLPPVLHIHFNLFEYNSKRSIEGNFDSYEFPENINLSKYLSKENNDKNIQYNYRLHGVLVHCGDLNSYQKYAFIQPNFDGKWFKFIDEKVIPVSKQRVFDGKFRFNSKPKPYMLVYIRESEIPEILKPIQESDLPEYLLEKFKESEKKKKDIETHIIISVLDNKIIKKNINGFDLFNYDNSQFPKSNLNKYKCNITNTIDSFKEMLSMVYCVKKSLINLWIMERTKYFNFRPTQLIHNKDQMTIGEIINFESIISKVKNKYSKCFFYVNFKINPQIDISDSNNVLIFLKFYDPATKKMKFMGNYFINKCERSLNSIVPKINRLKKFPENTELLFYKEVNYDHIKKIDLNTYTEIENGDIICFQKQLTPSELCVFRRTSNTTLYITDYFEKLRNQVSISFNIRQPSDSRKRKVFNLESISSNDITKLKLLNIIGIDNQQIKKIKLNLFNEDKENNELFSCPICLSDYSKNIRFCSLGCGHVFCEACINFILRSQIHKCPKCRKEFQVNDKKVLYFD